ncbi:MAG: glucosamine-6-phosphate deaminase [Treponema sp.]|jgi:glucosamine-6-phosphate deaminase|nr:glucosamine-6-phosphate deaminase [Treponema sp.]
MRLIIFKDYQEMSIAGAEYITDRIAPLRGSQPFVLGLPTGSTPLGIYQELIRRYRQGKISFNRVISFNMDEYLGLAAEHPQSYHFFMQENFFSHIDIQAPNIHILNGETADPEEECRAYEEAIKAAGGIDLFLGGMGEDGHIAFNEPFSSLNSRTRVKTLTENTRAVNARFFDGDIDQVPRAALTVGVGTIMDARELLIAASGANKARALRDAVEGGVSHRCPLSCLQNHPKATIICDEAAAGELEAGTIDYFKGLEQSAREWASRELADRNQTRRPQSAREQTSRGQGAGENRP